MSTVLRLWTIVLLSILAGCIDPPKSPYVDVHDLVVPSSHPLPPATAYSSEDLYQLGRRHEHFTLDWPEAVRWYRLAAQQRHLDALYRLCVLTDRGLGTPQDFEEAAQWCRQAAEAGHAKAMVVLGRFFEQGHGVTKDHGQAYLWYNLAAARGLEEGARQRDRLARQMTVTQLTNAQHQTKTWMKSNAANSE
ncbi:MAG: sel1 repeat family protein [Nitrospira sp.]|nr:sel1 repeat family protein [Nitrospira sp.]